MDRCFFILAGVIWLLFEFFILRLVSNDAPLYYFSYTGVTWESFDFFLKLKSADGPLTFSPAEITGWSLCIFLWFESSGGTLTSSEIYSLSPYSG